MSKILTATQTARKLSLLILKAKLLSVLGTAVRLVRSAYSLGIARGRVLALSKEKVDELHLAGLRDGKAEATRAVANAVFCGFVTSAGASAIVKFLSGKLDVDHERKKRGVGFFAWVNGNKKSCCTQYANGEDVKCAPFRPDAGSVKMESCEQDD